MKCVTTLVGSNDQAERIHCLKDPAGFIYWTFDDGVKILMYHCEEHLYEKINKVFTGTYVPVMGRNRQYCIKKSALMKKTDSTLSNVMNKL